MADLNYITPEYLHPYLTYIRDNRHIFSTMLKHANSFGFEAIFERMLQSIFDPILNRFGYPAENRKYVMRFYLSGINALTAEWVRDGCAKSISDMSQIIRDCIFGLDGQLMNVHPVMHQ